MFHYHFNMMITNHRRDVLVIIVTRFISHKIISANMLPNMRDDSTGFEIVLKSVHKHIIGNFTPNMKLIKLTTSVFFWCEIQNRTRINISYLVCAELHSTPSLPPSPPQNRKSRQPYLLELQTTPTSSPQNRKSRWPYLLELQTTPTSSVWSQLFVYQPLFLHCKILVSLPVHLRSSSNIGPGPAPNDDPDRAKAWSL